MAGRRDTERRRILRSRASDRRAARRRPEEIGHAGLAPQLCPFACLGVARKRAKLRRFAFGDLPFCVFDRQRRLELDAGIAVFSLQRRCFGADRVGEVGTFEGGNLVQAARRFDALTLRFDFSSFSVPFQKLARTGRPARV